MRTRRRASTEDLRRAIECLPRATRIAMLEAIKDNEIIVGAYAHGGGICPMLAAHRAGGRTNLISFAKAWDRFAFRGAGRAKPRRATERELLTLRTHLEASLLDDEAPASTLAGAIAEHRELTATRRPRPGDRNLAPRLRHRPGWAWMGVVRRYDDYERALDALENVLEAPTPARAGAGDAAPILPV